MSGEIYLDYQATTPMAPEAVSAMVRLLETGFANPHSSHSAGRQAAAMVEVAREQIVAPFGPDGKLVFTSGATEALNLALIGATGAMRHGKKGIVTLASEHAAVLDTVQWLAGQGLNVTMVPVKEDGLVELGRLQESITDDVGLVAAMLVNNEIGVIQPVDAIADIAHRHGALMLVDAVQGYGRVPLPKKVDMIAISSHKIHGPKGIGALWVRDGTMIAPVQHGGGQEQGLRSGTLAPALCAGFGVAAQLCMDRLREDRTHVERLWEHALQLFSDWTLNGSAEARYHGNLNIRRDGLDVGRLMADVRKVAFSAGSACASGSGRASHVLKALGLSTVQARSSIRLGFGRYTTLDDLDVAAKLLNDAAGAQY